MKYEQTSRFQRDWDSLPRQHQIQFAQLMTRFSAACDRYLADPTRVFWPQTLRVSPLNGWDGIWEMTWSFASPDGRATFEFVRRGGETRLVWRRIGDHSIYKGP